MKNFYIKQKVFSIGEKFTVKDASENICYRIQGSFFKVPKTFSIENVQGVEIATITKKILSLLPVFYVKIRGQEMIKIKKELSLFKSNYSLSAHGLTVKGDWWDMDFDIQKNRRKVGSVRKKWFSWGDSYEVSVFDESLEELIIALVIAIDCVKADEQAAASSAST
ncbi:LURP-one-related/scramblase family protein [Vagococcus elongatus]|uniref:LURP-one-related family protein n=1 Tax=Vagococcus elongatus TaxID=180344 RepID=A0A430B5J5_9ENTE|nr:LURP-one-related family protein [Vagococcus elongatus]RSU15512.1 hypothetical protein CBF29_00080 [Vagococcus elongatus]